jgi:hypothetical protein
VSRGPGVVQQFILAAIRDFGGVLPLISIATAAGYDITELSVRQSFARAGRKLADDGKIEFWYLTVPTARNGLTGELTCYRRIAVVGQWGVDPNRDDWELARERAHDVLFPEVTRAEHSRQYVQNLWGTARTVMQILETSDNQDTGRDRVTKLVTGALADSHPELVAPVIEMVMRELAENQP